MPLKPREMSGAEVPAIGVPSWLMFTVPALASALACVTRVHVCPGATWAGSTARCAETGVPTTATTATNSAFQERMTQLSQMELVAECDAQVVDGTGICECRGVLDTYQQVMFPSIEHNA